MEKKDPNYHSMLRRMATHNYSLSGIYHITMHVAEGMGQPLGLVEGSLELPNDTLSGPHVALTPIGQMVREELLTSITAHYSMISIDTFVIMPEHIHVLLQVTAPLVSSNGRSTYLGHVIAGFKKGCNRRYWAMTGQDIPAGKPLNTLNTTSCASMPSCSLGATMPSGSPTVPVPSGSSCASMPSGSFGVSVPSGSSGASVPSGSSYVRVSSGSPAGNTPAFVTLDTYGSRQLLSSRLLPVVCHYKEKARFAQQKARCLEEAAHGAVLVSARIAPGEQEIMKEALNHSFPVIVIADNGFPERYHPAMERINRCASGQLLLVTPWQYQYRGKNEKVTISFCKAMNCVAQALCRLKDDWWKSTLSVSPVSALPSASPFPMVSSGSPAPMVSSGSPAGKNK